jgi:integrase
MPQKARPRFDASRNQWRIYHAGKQHFLCSGAAAEAQAWELAAKLVGRPIGAVGDPDTVPAAVDQWLTQRGTDWHTAVLTPFMRFAAGMALASVHADYLGDYLLHLEQTGYERTRQVLGVDGVKRPRRTRHKYSASTLRRQVGYAHTVLAWAHTRRYMPVPVPAMPRLPATELADRSIGREQLEQIFAALQPRARAILAFIALTGCRPAEACLLTHEEVHGDICELLRGKTFKRTGRPRILYLSPAAHEAIAAAGTSYGYVFRNKGDQPYRPSGLRSIFRRAAAKAGVKATGTYQLRHSWAQFALDSGVISQDGLGEALGHALGSPATRQYAHITQRRALKEVRSLDALVSPSPAQATGRGSRGETSPRRKTGRQNRRKTAKARSGRRVG